MYERFYQLRERPFALSPDPDYLYPSRVHREALNYLRYGLESHAGFVVITGEIGSGKTTLLQTLLRGLDSQTTVGRIVNTMLDPRELIETIMIDFGLDPAGRSKPLLLRDLAQYLVDQRLAGRLVLLVIDEAQNLSLAALEELRMLSNLETEKSKLLQIVLVGQPNLRDKLGAPELEQLRQRITVSYHLQPLDAEETANYINHRLRRAALGAPLEFPRDVTELIHGRSRGVPRIINVICDATLVFGYAEERHLIDLSLMDDVLAELEATGVLPPVGGGPAQAPPDGVESVAVRVPRPMAAAAAPEPARSDAVGPEPPRLEPVGVEAPRPAPVPLRAVAPPPTAPSPFDRQPGPAPREVAARNAALDEREQAILQRERELAEQRRILAEEYRLLRTRRAPVVTPTATPGSVSAAVRVQVPSSGRPAPARFGTPTHERWWTRFKRLMLGMSAPAAD